MKFLASKPAKVLFLKLLLRYQGTISRIIDGFWASRLGGGTLNSFELRSNSDLNSPTFFDRAIVMSTFQKRLRVSLNITQYQSGFSFILTPSVEFSRRNSGRKLLILSIFSESAHTLYYGVYRSDTNPQLTGGGKKIRITVLRRDIFAVTELAVDILWTIERIPRLSQTQYTESLVMLQGLKGAYDTSVVDKDTATAILLTFKECSKAIPLLQTFTPKRYCRASGFIENEAEEGSKFPILQFRDQKCDPKKPGRKRRVSATGSRSGRPLAPFLSTTKHGSPVPQALEVSHSIKGRILAYFYFVFNDVRSQNTTGITRPLVPQAFVTAKCLLMTCGSSNHPSLGASLDMLRLIVKEPSDSNTYHSRFVGRGEPPYAHNLTNAAGYRGNVSDIYSSGNSIPLRSTRVDKNIQQKSRENFSQS
ncbi:uncharacterized protein BDR25DRAFT_359724 [Lindgomyces ingoldianus]|uniref:Uncharacterized protein n=1 Tax=Lindgomyces ingoldianus TaxID=673940 RepID=A0ACB6QIF4_9PLEO|nr:uncharacterized protein BDR25DRAFT_359724 [Lindgomyces ingoldianus]KAF2466373.1 hypothetical protein BDR25DRAFT_359724 [Lindgomyces ingoldianus]